MGRLAVVLGSNALGPGGERDRRRGGRARGGDRPAPRRRRGDLRPPPHDRPRGPPAAAGRAGLRPRAGDRLGRLAEPRSSASAASSAPTTSSPSTSATRSSATPAPTRRRASTRSWRERSDRRLGRGRPGSRVDGGVYWQAIGPRFETPAEIRLIAAHADVVGMTVASECVVAGELGLDYAALCVVDNLANGLGEAALSAEAMEADRPPTPSACATAWRRCCRDSGRSGR